MKQENTTVLLAKFLLIGSLALATGCAGVSSAMLSQQVKQLRDEILSMPTTSENYLDRLRVLDRWGNALASPERLLFPQYMQVTLTGLITGPFNSQTSSEVERWAKTLEFVEQNWDRWGTLVRTDRTRMVAGEYATLTLEYTVGELEIGPGQSLLLGRSILARQSQMQVTRPRADHYVSFKVIPKGTEASVETKTTSLAWQSQLGGDALPALEVTGGYLKPGDKVVITIGDRSQGSRGYGVVWRDSDQFRFSLQLDIDGRGNSVTVGVADVAIEGNRLAGLAAVVPSVVQTGEPFGLRLRLEDEYNNPASYDGGRFDVLLAGRSVGEIEVGPGSYLGLLTGLEIDTEGGYKFQIKSHEGKFSCFSNPVLVEKDPGARIYWGELHGHSGWEEGMGSVPRYYEYARDVAFLDFASLTGHDSQLVDEAWQQIRRETRRANRIGSFVGFMGYEWTVMRDRGGHHNVFFKNDPGRYVTQREAPRLPQLYQQLKKIDSVENILVIPHAHNPGDWNTSDDEVQRLVEIASVHGNFEYFGNRYLQNGYRVGLIGASDDHAGHPGSSSPLFATRNGLAAVYAEGPTREAIWESLRGRATYATSNAQRIVVRMTVGDQPVGTSLPIARAPVMEARVLGTAPIDHIDVVRNGEVVFSRDYLKPQSEAAQAVQLMFHSPTETPGTSNIPPLAAVMWQGWIEVSGAEIVSVRVLGQDHVSDEFHQVGATKAWFTVKTRGDFDGAWIRLTKIQPDASLSVRVASL